MSGLDNSQPVTVETSLEGENVPLDNHPAPKSGELIARAAVRQTEDDTPDRKA